MFAKNQPPSDMAPGPETSIPSSILGLMALLVGIHLGRWLAGEAFYDWSLESFAYISPWTLEPGESLLPGQGVWGMLSYSFLHADWVHLLMNCVWLLIFGTLVTRRMGTGRMLVIAGFSAICGCLAALAVRYGEPFVLVGASGAISGLLAASAPLMFGLPARSGSGGDGGFHDRLALNPVDLLRSRPALVFAGSYVVIALVNAIGVSGVPGVSGAIAWDAHIGGFAGGLIAFYLVDKGPRTGLRDGATFNSPPS